MQVTWLDTKQSMHGAKNLHSDKKSISNINGDGTISKTIKTDLYHALVPIYYLSKIFGLLPVRFVPHTSGRYVGNFRIPDVCYSLDSVGLLLFFVGAETWGLWRDLKDGWANSSRHKTRTGLFVAIGDAVAIQVLAGVAVIGAFSRWKYLRDIVVRLVEADERLGFLAPKKTRGFSIMMSGGILSFLVILSILDLCAWNEKTKSSKNTQGTGQMNYSPIYILYMIAMMLEIQYTVSTNNLGERFTRLNKNLENLLKGGRSYDNTRKDLKSGDSREQGNLVQYIRPEIEYNTSIRVYRTPKKSSNWFVNEGDTRNIADAISQLITVHSSLCDVVLLINRAFGVPILVLTITCLLHLIIPPYVLMADASSHNNALFITVQCLWCCLHVTRMLIVIEPCYSTANEAKGTAIKVGQLLSVNWEPEIRKQLEIFSLQLLHRPLDFTVCGMFSLDRALITSMTATVSTYLVILLQFQKADDEMDAKNMLKNATEQFLKNATSLTSQRHSNSFQ